MQLAHVRTARWPGRKTHDARDFRDRCLNETKMGIAATAR